MEDLVRKAFGIRISVMAVLAALAALALSSSAVAQVTVGQIAPTPNPEVNCIYGGDPYDEFQTSVAAGASYVVPAAGVLTSWSTNAGSGAGQVFGFKIFRPLAPSVHQVVAHDGPRPLAPSALNTFPVNIPVQAGDVIGISFPPLAPPTACAFATLSPADQIVYREGNLADGDIFTPESGYSGSRLNLSATLLQPPVISAVTPAEGSIQGGQAVVVAGANFASVQAVSFGAVPAQTFAVNSEGQITAIAPPSKTLSATPVTVTTVAGTASSAQTFVYRGCQVPKLKGSKLKASKRKATKADCKIGKVKKKHGATAKTGKVVKQNPQPGKLLPPGTKIKITLDD
jgi:hypothetical protein